MIKNLIDAKLLLVGRQPLVRLEQHSKSLRDQIDTLNRRSRVSIAVIDDQPFSPLEDLRKAGFQVSYLGRETKLEVIRKFGVALCDIKGVADDVNPAEQGVFLIKEIRRQLPEVLVLAYTGLQAHSALARMAAQHSDGLLSKTADLGRIISVLDPIVDKVLSPYELWQRVRVALVERRIDSYDLCLLEQGFIRSTLSGSPAPFERAIGKVGAGSEVKPIIQGLISSAIWAFIMGG